MSNGGGAAAGAAAAAIAQAIKASGVIVRIEPEDFLEFAARLKDPLVVTAEGGVFSTTYEYLTTYRGLAFYTKSKSALSLPIAAEVIKAKSIWIPA